MGAVMKEQYSHLVGQKGRETNRSQQPLAARIDVLLPRDDLPREDNVVLSDAHFAKERLERPARLQFLIGEAGGTDARQRAPRQRHARRRGERAVQGEFRVPLDEALEVQFVLPGSPVLLQREIAADAHGIDEAPARIADGMRDVQRFGALEEAHDVHEFGDEHGKIGRQHRTHPL